MSENRADVGIKTLGPRGLERLFSDLGEPAYRTAQVMRWLYRRGVSSWDEMTDLPAPLRASLAEEQPLAAPTLLERQTSTDGSRKYLWSLADGSRVESVGLPAADRLTVCFSTQAGCAMGCTFCATAAGGFARSLFPGEMADQVRLVGGDFAQRVTHAVAMGQGEPFAAYDATLEGLRLMNSPDGLGIGARHLTVSTCGIVPGILAIAEEPEQFTLAVSLHSAVQPTRDRLMPGVSRYPLTELRRALDVYVRSTGRRVSLEYALAQGLNDTPAQVAALITFCEGLLCHVNLIPVNRVAGSPLGRTPSHDVSHIADRIAEAGVPVTLRTERGADIDAACGQLSQRHADESG